MKMAYLNKYNKNTDGNVAVMFAVTAFMLLTAVGAAVDYTAMVRAQSQLQSQVDAGVLAAATVDIKTNENGKEKKTREEIAYDIVEANGFDLSQSKPKLKIKSNSVILTAESIYKPRFAAFLGFDTVKLSAAAESGLPQEQAFDVVLVLDNTESMDVNGKLEALKDGATQLIEAIESGGSGTKIGIVPFARYVRVSDTARTASWFDMPDESDHERTEEVRIVDNPGTCRIEPRTRNVDGETEVYDAEICEGRTFLTDTVDETLEARWEGCVGTRVPPYSERDGDYAHRIPGLLRINPQEVTGLSFDKFTRCPSEITPVTDDYELLKEAIDDMRTTDNTYLPTGLIWGQRVLSPGEPYDNSVGPGETEKNKIMILMTDGNNTTQIELDSLAESQLRSPPFISDVEPDVVATDANAATSRLCDYAKESGTEIYTIAFRVSDPTTRTLLKQCASADGNALSAESNSALVERFSNLASEFTGNIRLTR
jgi:Flp pilus assembly protein TadG